MKFNLLESFPKINRENLIGTRTEKNRKLARKFGKEFFDGERINGYGGYIYDGRWIEVVHKMKERYNISPGDAVLDIGCGKGFLLHDIYSLTGGQVIPCGIDISEYAINNGMEIVKPFMVIGNCLKLPYANKSFQCVVAINTLHNLNKQDIKKAIKEMIRVCSKPKNMFIQLDAFRNKEEEKRMKSFNLTAKTILSDKEWIKLFKEVGYKGDYYFTIP